MKAISICAGLLGVFCVAPAQQLPSLKTTDWKPPKTNLPPDFVDAVRDLLGNGIADPRGGSFHKVKVLTGDATFPQLSPVGAYGWILPGNKTVVCVDGLTYELVQDLGASRLEEVFMASAIPVDRPYFSLRINGPNAVLNALLLVTGRTDLISQQMVGSSDFLGSLFLNLRDSLQTQTAQNLMVKRDQEAYSYAEKLYLSGLVRQKYSPLFQDFSRLFADSSEERILTGMLLRFNQPKLENSISRNGPEKIRTLITRLDEVQVQDRSGLGALDYFNDPIVKELLAEGDAAVSYLLDVVAKDKRLTRSVRVVKPLSSAREIVTVSELAARCVAKLWPGCKRYVKSGQPDSFDIPALRQIWKELKGKSEFRNPFCQTSPTVPDGISSTFVECVNKLIGNGLSDPENGKFHSVEIVVGNAIQEKPVNVKTFGWISEDGKSVVCIDGLTYPVAKDKGPYELSKFVTDVFISDYGLTYNSMPVADCNFALPAVLLAGGNYRAAKYVLNQMSGFTKSPETSLMEHLYHRYMMQVADSLKKFNDQDAAKWSSKLLPIVSLSNEYDNSMSDKYLKSNLNLPFCSRLVADCQRRVLKRKPKFTPKMLDGLTESKRIELLVKYMDEVTGFQISQPGTVNFSGNPIVRAIRLEGAAMKNALMEVAANDVRFTRAVGFHRDFFPHRKIFTVAELATRLLQNR